MLSFYVVNLLIPGDPDSLPIASAGGLWTLTKAPGFASTKAALTGANVARPKQPLVGETYFLENPVDPRAGYGAVDAAIEEITPILLAASYATGLSVTIERSTAGSAVALMQPTHQWPRARGIESSAFVINTADEFRMFVERFVQAWPSVGQSEKVLLLVHHWLDSIACWSMEDLYLSATTLLQIVAATEASKQGKDLSFFQGIEDAAKRAGIPPLGKDFKNMRNELVHDGRLIGTRFAGPRSSCDGVVADVLNWFDAYLHAALGFGPVARTRFQARDFAALNAYSI